MKQQHRFSILIFVALLSACSVGNRPMRPNGPEGNSGVPAPKQLADPPTLGNSYFIESDSQPKFSCSFIEYDEQGDFLNPKQQDHAFAHIEKQRSSSRPLLLFMYCHGWNNSSQSMDVLRFNDMLYRLSQQQELKNYQVHGVYLAWRGKIFKPDINEEECKSLLMAQNGAFGDDLIVDTRYRNPIPFRYLNPSKLFNFFSYWNRKNVAENNVSGVPLSRSIFELSGIAKSGKNGNKNIVLLMGHSFGALALEQSVGEGAIGFLQDHSNRNQRAAEWPFDLFLLVNSAGPSIYSKLLQDSANSLRLYATSQGKNLKGPLAISLTSKSDRATRVLHRLANSGTHFMPSMSRRYSLTTHEGQQELTSGYFYRRTPGHNPYLINRQITLSNQQPPTISVDEVFHHNLVGGNSKGSFLTSARGKHQGITSWTITTENTNPAYNNERDDPKDDLFWIVRCPKAIIGEHSDIWNDRALELYAALLRESGALSPAL